LKSRDTEKEDGGREVGGGVQGEGDRECMSNWDHDPQGSNEHTLHHAATICNTATYIGITTRRGALQHPATHIQHTATHCNTDHDPQGSNEQKREK